ncbi:hypothetical protein FACS1894158_08020 [Betaproteobacteria bacterium]|nr:hypothetical protein FACS1894158_08020 [Betaproteobacteria bacterium]
MKKTVTKKPYRFQPESSLVNTAFQKKKRWIGNPDIPKDLRDFDALEH